MTEIRTTQPVLVLIQRTDRPGEYLLEFNENWRAAMFPVTKPREYKDQNWGTDVKETPLAAASRAACEATGLLNRESEFEAIEPIQLTAVSQSQGDVTGYNFNTFSLKLKETQGTLQQQRYWVSLDDLLDPELGPISPVARQIAKALLERELNS